MKTVIIGYGSIGKRHANNLKSLNHDVSIFDKSEIVRKTAEAEGYDTCSSIESTIQSYPEVVLICTETYSHIPIAKTILTNDNPNLKGLFIEKPLSYDLNGTHEIISLCKERNVKLMVGCNLRYMNGTNLVKTLLYNSTIGKVYASHYFYGYDLKQWHPETDYTKSYSAGIYGGILLDDIHAIDLMIHLFGKIIDIKGVLKHTKTLHIVKEEIADYIISFEDITCHIHSDYLCPVYQRTLEIFGTKGIITYDFSEGQVNLKTVAIPEWRAFNTKEDINNMYLNEMEYFIECVQKSIQPISNGVESLKWIMELKKQNGVI